MVPGDIRTRRLVNQQIVLARHKKPFEVVASLAAVQAQDFAGGLWTIGLRLPGATESEVKQALAERTIIRTWMMRGTLHFVAAADVHWMRELLAPRLVSTSANRFAQLDLTAKIFGRSEGACLKALQGGGTMTRGEIYKVLERSRISTAGQRGAFILWRLAHDGVICFGVHAGKQQTFVLLDEWAPKAKKVERDHALAELARRYFCSHGPATLQDFGWWSGLKAADARAAVEMASSKLARETMDGKVYWMPEDLPVAADAPSAVNLLPGFDEYLIGYKDRSASLDPRHARQNRSREKRSVAAHGGELWPRRGHMETRVREKCGERQGEFFQFAKEGRGRSRGRGGGTLRALFGHGSWVLQVQG